MAAPGFRSFAACAAALAVLTSAGCRENIVLPTGRPSPPPILNSISPSEAQAGSASINVTVHGEDFTDSSRVLFDGSERPTQFLTARTLMAALSREDVAAGGRHAIAVYTPPPGGGLSDTALLVLVAVPEFSDTAPAPVVSWLVPAMAARGGPAARVAVYGSGFTPRSVALWNGEPRPTTLMKDWKLYISLSAADLAAAGPAAVSVRTAEPGGGTAAAHPFAVVSEAPGRPRTWTFASVPLNGAVTWAAIAATGLAYVARPGTDSIAPLDLEAGALRPSFAVGSVPGDLVFDSPGANAYMLARDAAAVAVLATGTSRRTATFALPAGPLRLALDQSDSTLFVTLADATLAVLDAATGAVHGRVGLAGRGTSLALAPGGARLWVGTDEGWVHELDVPAGTPRRAVRVGERVTGLAAAPGGRWLYAANGGDEVIAVDLESFAAELRLPIPNASHVAVTRDGSQLWVVRAADGRITVVDTGSHEVLGVVYVTGSPQRIVFDRGGAVGLVTNENGLAQVIR